MMRRSVTTYDVVSHFRNGHTTNRATISTAITSTASRSHFWVLPSGTIVAR